MFKVFKKKTGSKTHKKNYRRKTRKSRKSRNSKYRQKRNLKNNYRKKRSRKRVGAGSGPMQVDCNHIYGNIGHDGLVQCRKCGDKKYPIKPATFNYNNANPNMNYQYGYEGTKPIGPLGTTNRGKIDYGPYHVPVKSALTRRRTKDEPMDSLGNAFGNIGFK